MTALATCIAIVGLLVNVACVLHLRRHALAAEERLHQLTTTPGAGTGSPTGNHNQQDKEQ
jgi:Co/Zn/Cd efflux system component